MDRTIMFRKPRQPAPYFGMPGAPFNPTTGERAPLGPTPPRGTTLAMFQVIEDDTHDNYVVCRGYEADSDPEFLYHHDPYTNSENTPINVAKPYSIRGTFPYTVGDVIVAARIKGKLGFNPGFAATTVGQPANLDEEIELLLDDDGVGISWMDVVTTGASPPSYFLGTFGFNGTTLTFSESLDSDGLWTAGTISVSNDKLVYGGESLPWRISACVQLYCTITSSSTYQTAEVQLSHIRSASVITLLTAKHSAPVPATATYFWTLTMPIEGLLEMQNGDHLVAQVVFSNSGVIQASGTANSTLNLVAVE